MPEPVGKRYEPVVYAVGREAIRAYATAVGEEDPRCHDPAAARAAGHADVLAPPMFAAVYSARAVAAGLLDPQLGIDMRRLVHAAQAFAWGAPVVAGDEVTTTAEVAEVSHRGGLGVFTFATTSVNQRGEPVCEGTWTNVVR